MHIHAACFKAAKTNISIETLQHELSQLTGLPPEQYNDDMLLYIVSETYETYVPLRLRHDFWKTLFIWFPGPISKRDIVTAMLGKMSITPVRDLQELNLYL